MMAVAAIAFESKGNEPRPSSPYLIMYDASSVSKTASAASNGNPCGSGAAPANAAGAGALEQSQNSKEREAEELLRHQLSYDDAEITNEGMFDHASGGQGSLLTSPSQGQAT